MHSQAGKNHRFLVCLSRRVGFFALFFQVLGQLYLCKKESIIPLVFWGKHCLFWDHEGRYSSHNAWDYFFEPVSEYEITQVLPFPIEQLKEASIYEFTHGEVSHAYIDSYPPSKAKTLQTPSNVILTNQWPEFEPGKEDIIEERRPIFNGLITQYIRIKPCIMDEVNSFFETYFAGHFVIGVHIRGAEHNNEVVQWYRKKVADEKVYWKEIKRVLSEHKDAKIFLATDTKPILDNFKKKYGQILIHHEAHLSDFGKAPHYQFKGADIAKEVLIECLLLSRCNYLIHGISNVAYAALCFNPKLPHLNIYKSRTKSPFFLKPLRDYFPHAN